MATRDEFRGCPPTPQVWILFRTTLELVQFLKGISWNAKPTPDSPPPQKKKKGANKIYDAYVLYWLMFAP